MYAMVISECGEHAANSFRPITGSKLSPFIRNALYNNGFFVLYCIVHLALLSQAVVYAVLTHSVVRSLDLKNEKSVTGIPAFSV